MNDLYELAQEVGSLLLEKKLKIATAESCTGGGLSYWLTSVPGSSAWFDRGFVTYSNEAKIGMLGVNASTLNTFGAVSEETAKEMVQGALKFSNADIGVAITGIAGPEGGSEQKPVGTVWLAFYLRGNLPITEANLFTGNREIIRHESILKSLNSLKILI